MEEIQVNAQTQEMIEVGKIKEQVEDVLKRAKECAKGADSSSKKAAEAEGRIADILNKASEAQIKADSEALRAFQAKENVEAHSNAVAKLKGSIEADVASVLARKAEIDNLAQVIINLRAGSESDAMSIGNARKTAEEAMKAVAEASAKAATVQTTLEETRKNIDVISQEVSAESKTVKADLAEVDAAQKKSAALVAAAQQAATITGELRDRVKAALGVVETCEKESRAKLDSMSALVGKTQEMEQKVESYQVSLAKLQVDYQALRAHVESLLPGATSAGLASAFSRQKERFKSPQKNWMMIFILCIFLLLGITLASSLNHLTGPVEGWDEITRHFLQRLPYMIPLVWLGIYSGRQYNTALRMEEEYAIKEALSTAFEGYKREMGSLPEIAQAQETPLNKLCVNVLTLLARRPGLIYEGHHQDITPLTPAVDALERLLPSMTDTIVAKIKAALKPGS